MPQPLPPPPAPLVILLAGGNRDGSVARKIVLEEHGYRVLLAVNGEEACETLSRERVDLLVTDYRMPRMDGKELIARVRQTNPETPVILLAGYLELMGMNEKDSGADLVLTKGAHEVNHLVRGVSRLLARRSGRKPPEVERRTRTTRAGVAKA